MKKAVAIFIAIIVLVLVVIFVRNYLGLNGKSKIMNEVTEILEQSTPSESSESSNQNKPDVPYRIEKFMDKVYVPWSMVWTSPTRMLFNERNGRIRVAENGTLAAKPLIEFSEVSATSEEGLMEGVST